MLFIDTIHRKWSNWKTGEIFFVPITRYVFPLSYRILFSNMYTGTSNKAEQNQDYKTLHDPSQKREPLLNGK